MSPVKKLKTFKTKTGIPIFQIPIEAFPGLWTYAYLVLLGDYQVLIDTGSSFSSATEQLIGGIQEAGNHVNGRHFSISGLTHVMITHGHIDHFGGLPAIRERSDALVGIHELDRRNVTHFAERRILNLQKLSDYLIKAGVGILDRENLLQFYRYLKDMFETVEVDYSYEAIDMELGPFRILHAPGHSGGHVVIRLEDILFCGDHILSEITPHQVAEELSPWSGLNHYLNSLDAVERWSDGINLALCGHKQEITDLPARISAIKEMHMERLDRVLNFFGSPNTISALSKNLFGNTNGFNALLAIEEAGAHVEYLYQRGMLKVVNYEEGEKSGAQFVHLFQCS
jgi:glyoxylase-like metal-dependent hydrolase (beta-lactamase superfamily II)